MATVELPEVVVSPLQPKGQSNANIPMPTANKLATRIGGLSSLPPTPEHIAASSEQNTLVYPSDRPKYFMNFGIYDYSRDGLLEVGTLNPWTGGSNQILLPLAETLVDQLEARWEEAEIGWMVGGVAESLKGISSADEAIDKIKTITKDFSAEAIKALTSGSALEAATALKSGRYIWPITQAGLIDKAGPAGKTIGALAGVAPNRFVTILYIGPEYKTYNFTWNLSPRNRQESETLRRIINVFKKAMSPTVRYTVLWGYPCIFRIMFRPNNEQLYKFRPCILKRFSANWTPMGRAAFYNTTQQAGSYTEGNPPEGVTIQASFIEIEYWTQEKMDEKPIRQMSVENSPNW
jgi:hypothetical protein